MHEPDTGLRSAAAEVRGRRSHTLGAVEVAAGDIVRKGLSISAGQTGSPGRMNVARARLLMARPERTYLGVSTNTVRRYIARGWLTAHRVGPKLLRFDPTDLDSVAQRIEKR